MDQQRLGTGNSAEDHEEEDARDKELVAYLERIGAKSLATELSELRFRNRIIEAQRWLDTHEAQVSYQEKVHDEIDKRMIANNAALFDKAQGYMNFVVSFGYAGFFAIWSLIREQMHPWDMKFVAVLLGASLLTFVTWTVINSTLSIQGISRVAKTFGKTMDSREDMLDAVLEAEAKNQVVGLRLQVFWLPVFAFTVFTGFLAGVTLLVLLLADILGWGFSVNDLLLNLFLKL